VNDPAGRQPIPIRDASLSDWTTVELSSFFQQIRSGRSMDRAIDSATT
jgi:hypothetical protein